MALGKFKKALKDFEAVGIPCKMCLVAMRLLLWDCCYGTVAMGLLLWDCCYETVAMGLLL